MVGIVVLTAACSSGSSSSSSASADTNAAKDAAFVRCMASHGVTVTVNSSGGIVQGSNGSNPPSQSQVQSARSACNHTLPNGSQPSQGQQQQSVEQLVKYTQCMRAHGVSNMPDPSSDGTMHVGISVANSPHYQSAAQDCRSLLPPGGAP